ncbi:translocation/assembly module TamB domain-containing protein [Pseudopedobacter beijingensis]|uniref:Translocation/assembly module TamB domain-containing protein n=1 Tax=Pseudopedobacter beijingensis TaxID=1207056 RepID=A0ABW4IDY8_9SPHI
MKKYLKKTLKIFAWILGSIVGLLLLIAILIQIPSIQNLLKDKVISYLEAKIKTPVHLDRIYIGFPKKLVLKGVYFESLERDTLLAGEKLAVDISMVKLLRSEVQINSIDLEGITANVKRNQDSVFNFDYIIKAFASEQEKEPKPEDTTSTMKFSLGKINLDRIKIGFDDAITKNYLHFYIGHFDTSIKKFDLDEMDFDIPQVKLEELKLNLKQGIVEEAIQKATVAANETSATSPSLKLKLGEVDLSKIAVYYDSEETKLNADLFVGSLFVKLKDIDLDKQLVNIDKIDFKDTRGKLLFGKLDKKPEVKKDVSVEDSVSTNNWKVHVNKADFANIDFKFDDQNIKPISRGMDYMHLDFKELTLKAEDFYYSPDTISGNILDLIAKEKSGLFIETFKTDFFYGPQSAYLKKLYLKTPKTIIKDEIKLAYPSIASLTENLGDLALDASINGSRLGFKDILLFVPDLYNTNPFKDNPNAVLAINSRINGKIKDLRIPNLEISGIGTTRIVASGHITGMPDVDKANFDLNIKNFQTSGKDLYGFVPPKTIPDNISLPGYINLKGIFKGGINNFFTNLNLISSYGNASIRARFDQRVKNKEKYDAFALTNGIDIGKFLKNDSIGKIALQAKVEGVGLDPKTANAKFDGIINSAVYNKYVYKDLKAVGEIKNGLFDIKTGMEDPNLNFTIKANGSFKEKYPSVKVDAVLDSADFNKLNLYAGSLRLRLNMKANIETADPDYLNGRIFFDKIVVAQEASKFVLDSIYIRAKSTESKNDIYLWTPFMSAKVDGKYQFTQIGEALSNTVARYYNTDQKAQRKETTPQYFDFSAKLVNHPFIMQFLPDLKKLDPVVLKGHYNSNGDTLTVNGDIPHIVYGGNTINNGTLKVATKDTSLHYNLMFDEIKTGSMTLLRTILSGKVKNNVLDYLLQVHDRTNKERYRLGGNVEATQNATLIKLDPLNLKLDYDKWTIPEDNVIELGENIYARNFFLHYGNQGIKIASHSEEKNAPLAIDFEQFKIETITSIVNQDSLKVGGVIDGDILLRNLTTNMVFTSDITVHDFNFRGDTLGNIAVKVDNEIEDTFKANMSITGQGNQVNLTGSYLTASETLDMVLDVEKLNLKSLEGLSFGNISNTKGFLSGNFKIGGQTSAPRVIGELKFNDAAFAVTQTNSYFKSLNDKIIFDTEGIRFNRFKLTDSLDNKLTVNGQVLTKTYQDFKFKLDINAANFKVVSSTAKDNDLFYGDLFVDTRLAIRGDLDNPKVDGSLKIDPQTKFTMVLPSSDPSIADREGIVEFIDQDNMDVQNLFAVPDTLENSKIVGMDISVNIQIDKNAELVMIIDKNNGDFVKVKGDAELNGGIDPSGKITLTGRYELTEGTYEMSFNFINRKFDIQKGSSIVWTGEPMSAIVDITAAYIANTAPLDLLEDQLVDLSPAVKNTYKQKVPFQVLLNMDGELMQPEITFDIKLPDGNYNVSSEIVSNSQSKLEQLRQEPSELNKQVFALLLLNRFVGENPFASSSSAVGVNSMVRQSVSKLLSDQLNNLAGNLIQGVEVNFDLASTEDYSSGSMENRTDLNIGVSKRFLDDRLKVTVGSNFGLEGTDQPNRETNNIAGDIAVDYQLSKDGRYMLRAYRKNQYEVALQGQVIETGVGFVLTMDYNKFWQIFHHRKERKAIRRQEAKKE